MILTIVIIMIWKVGIMTIQMAIIMIIQAPVIIMTY